jgi:hypothetical protein
MYNLVFYINNIFIIKAGIYLPVHNMVISCVR